jgi:N-carbamoyl-L-amino-acid hydrolase
MTPFTMYRLPTLRNLATSINVHTRSPRRTKSTLSNAPAAQTFKVNSDRLWADIHHTAQWSAPNATTKAGGLSRLSGTPEDQKARDWFHEQIRSLGAAKYSINATGSQFATFPGVDNSLPPIAMGSHLDSVATGGRFDGPLGVIGALEVVRSLQEQRIQTFAPITLINWTNEEGARFFPPLGSSCVFAGQSTVDAAHDSKANNGSGETLGDALRAIGYVGDGPNSFEEHPLSAHFEIHVEQARALERAGKSVGWVEGWQGISVFEVVFRGEDGHANTYPMHGRRDSLVGASKLVVELDGLAYSAGGYTTATGLQSGPVGCCNIQSDTKLVFCVMHQELQGLESMGNQILSKAKAIASAHGLDLEHSRLMHLEPGTFWEEAVDCVRRACGDKGIGARTDTAHDSTMTQLKCPTAMVFARAKDGVSHAAHEWTDKEDCAESASVLGKSVLNFDQILRERHS